MFVGEVVSANIHEYYVALAHSFGRRAIHLWTSAYPLDVSNGEIHEDSQRLRADMEASMAEGYVMSETLGYCTEYMERIQGTRRRVWEIRRSNS
jgi:hypothetical protein